jgi:hypothetical protein
MSYCPILKAILRLRQIIRVAPIHPCQSHVLNIAIVPLSVPVQWGKRVVQASRCHLL